MAVIFPEAYPDELLYSLLARYLQRLGYRTQVAFSEDLFGKSSVAIPIDFPHYLKPLVDRLPEGHGYSVGALIWDHSFLPYFARFLPPERVNGITDAMKTGPGSPVYFSTGFATSGIPRRQNLMYCPVCAHEDEFHHGEAYWRRLHQLPGVMVCPEHKVFLEEGRAIAQASSLPIAFSDLAALRTPHPRPIDTEIPLHRVLLQIAQDSAYLLCTKPSNDYSNPKVNLKRLLQARGWARDEGDRLDHTRLRNAFLDHYSIEFLETLHCAPGDETTLDWFTSLIRPNRQSAPHPLHFILLVRFLGLSLAEYFTLDDIRITVKKSFGKGPWPCQNVASDHYGALTITQVLDQRKNNRFLMGTFRCPDCQFTYRRRHTGASRLYVLSYGPVWEDTLRGLFSGPKPSGRELQERLGVGRIVARQQAERIGIALPVWALTWEQGRSKTERPDLERERQEKRERWIRLRMEYPREGRTALKLRNPSLAGWLERYDKDWFLQNLPPEKSGRVPSDSHGVDWEARDTTYQLQAQQLVHSTLKQQAEPIWVTKKYVLETLGIHKANLSRLPQTANYVNAVSESHLEFARRRLRWITSEAISKGTRLKRWELVRSSNCARHETDLKSEIDECMALLEGRVGSAGRGA